MKKLSAFIFSLLLFYSCSSAIKSIYDSNYPLTSQKAYSKNTNISVNIPDGWFTAEDNDCNCIDLWLIKDDFSQSLNFSIINVDEQTKNDIRKNGIQKLAEYDKIFIKAKIGNSFKDFFNEENFVIGSKQFYAVQYLYDNNIVRIILFEHNNRFYELTAISKDPNKYEELWVIQNTVLTSIK